MADADSNPAVVVFDGECQFCSVSIGFIRRHDPWGALRFAPSQSDATRHLLAPFGVVPDALGSIALIAGSVLAVRSDAVLQIFARLGLPWRLVSRLAVIPRPLRDAVYAWVARNRHRLHRRQLGCTLPRPAVRAGTRIVGSTRGAAHTSDCHVLRSSYRGPCP
jgi:predicted DCC family thiol-disulfide oxidoreductase YuxK